ncbi:MAG TPA: outer membrane protein assembly factor BamE [Rhodospirillaceae bacterium]|nr:outer membrane protein assembly factor BamE [Rhodospirillaceae bacterium]
MSCFSARLCKVLLLLSVLGGCAPTIDLRGNQPLPDNLAQIQPGKVTKSDVVALIGTPASTSTFGDERWYYISSKVKTFAFFKPEEIERHVVEISFDRSGMVSSMRNLGLEDGKAISMTPGETPTAGKDLTFLEQLIGNVGKFNKPDKDRAQGP